MRRTCATGLQKLGVRLDVTEAVLNHVSGSRRGIVSIYEKHDYRPKKGPRSPLGAIASRRSSKGRAEVSNVIPLKAGEPLIGPLPLTDAGRSLHRHVRACKAAL